jgi:hypothetical protein
MLISCRRGVHQSSKVVTIVLMLVSNAASAVTAATTAIAMARPERNHRFQSFFCWLSVTAAQS